MADPPSPHRGVGVAGPVVAAALVATLAFAIYTRTLLPGVDLGDTGGFQAAVLWPEVSARQAYPLYYNLARPFVLSTCGFRLQPEDRCDPARALNLFSAVAGAAAVGLLVIFTALITASTVAGVAAGLLLAFSYTFWSQAIIAEVYTLHLVLIAACCLALHAYARQPGLLRIALFFAIYAAAFGNHLSMVLLLIPFAVFLVLATPDRGWLFSPRVIGIALIAAIAAALQYWPNLMSIVTAGDAPVSWSDRLAAFWFDTTKSDWRETMVLGIEGPQLADRLAMWWFDARQQFGIVGLALGAAGAIALWRQARTWAITLPLAWSIATLFALTYNVGDTHVFFLPAHLLLASMAGVSVTWVNREKKNVVLFVLSVSFVVGYGLWRGWTTYPALDRHEDRRGEALIARLTLGISDPDAMLVSSMNWQLENVLLYVGRHHRPDLTWTRLGDVLPHFPLLLDDQREIARDVVLTRDAAAEVVAAYGPLEPLVADPLGAVESLEAQARRIPRGAPYVLSVLTPPREERLDTADLAAAIAFLTGGAEPVRRPDHFELIAGLAGERALVYRSSPRPFTEHFRPKAEATEAAFTVRMDAWLPSDTFRRAGFGHVLRGRAHVQILERGVNLVWVQPDGSMAPPVYAASLFAPQPRFRLLGPAPTLAATEP